MSGCGCCLGYVWVWMVFGLLPVDLIRKKGERCARNIHHEHNTSYQLGLALGLGLGLGLGSGLRLE